MHIDWRASLLVNRSLDKAKQMTLPIDTDCQSVKKRLDSGETFLFLDCREATEHATAHIQGTTLIPMSELAARVQELEPYRNSPVVVHCGRSLRVTNWLRQQGFEQTVNLAGGIDEWSQKIDPSIPRY